MRYLHPYFCLIQLKEYKKYKSFCHHGAPAVNTMLDIYSRGRSNEVVKEFPGLGHSSGKGWTWEGNPKEFIRHDVAGTRKIRRDKGKPEIEGVWDPIIKVIDRGSPDDFNCKRGICAITCTGDRPIPFSLSERWMRAQTIQPDLWIIVDDGKIPSQIPDLPYVRYIRRERKSTDPIHTMILNLEEAMKYISRDKIFIWEDDEYYAPKYLENLSQKLDRYEVVGIGKSKYYYLPGLTYYQHPNMRHASLAQTGFRESFLTELNAMMKGDCFLDLRIWNKINPGEVSLSLTEIGNLEYVSKNGRGYIFDDRDQNLYVGMKGLEGRIGIGAGHRGIGVHDVDRSILKKWIPKEEDFNIYMSLKKNNNGAVNIEEKIRTLPTSSRNVSRPHRSMSIPRGRI